MKTQTIIQKIQADAEYYGCVNEMRGAISKVFQPIGEYPRCFKCGRPFTLVEMTDVDEIFVGCPNRNHHEGDVRIRVPFASEDRYKKRIVKKRKSK